MTFISSRDDFHLFHLGVWSFTFECLHDLEQKCVRPGIISSRGEPIFAPNHVNTQK